MAGHAGGATWTKLCPSPEAAAREAAGLEWLAAAPGGPDVVGVHGRDGARLELERVHSGRATRHAARRFGADLARLHAAGADYWGSPPPGTSGAGTLGAAALATPEGPPAGWGEFYATQRLAPHLERALALGQISGPDAAAVRAVVDAVQVGSLDHPQPGLVGERPARLHGDLWNGNVLWRSGDGVAMLIDPAAHGGHAETDLAMLALFGAPHLAEIYEGYDAASPLAPGWRSRVPLHQLHPLLVHAELFGGDYGAAAGEAAREVLR